MRLLSSLRGRLLLVMGAVFLLGVMNVGIYLLDLDNDVRKHVLKEQIDTLLAGVETTSGTFDFADLPLRFSESDWRYALYGRSGDLITTVPPGSTALPFLEPEGTAPDRQSTTESRRMSDGNVLVIRRNDWQECEELCQIFRQRLAGSAIGITILAAISLTAMVMLTYWVTGAIRQASQAASRIGRENLDQRIPLTNLPDEVAVLASAANQALDRLSDAYSHERRFTADAAHELRTPLAILDLRLQQAQAQRSPDWGVIAGDMRNLRALLDQLLALARADAHEKESAAEISLARTIREAAATMMPAFEAEGRLLELELPDRLPVRGDAEALRRVFLNLLENALRHGRGVVRVAGRVKSGRDVMVTVSDEGAGLSTAEGEPLFNRFHKGRQNTEGSGLGLSIVRQILNNHDGSAQIVPGAGFTMELVLPISSDGRIQPTK